MWLLWGFMAGLLVFMLTMVGGFALIQLWPGSTQAAAGGVLAIASVVIGPAAGIFIAYKRYKKSHARPARRPGAARPTGARARR